MASDGSAITIDRVYFETLVRRAKFNTGEYEMPVEIQQPPTPSISITLLEHEGLKLIAKQYANLRRNLLRGGVDGATILLLSQDDGTIQQDHKAVKNSSSTGRVQDYRSADGAVSRYVATRSSSRQPSTGHANANYFNGSADQQPESPDWADNDPLPDDASGSLEADVPIQFQPQTPRMMFKKQCIRTIQLLNLPEGTTHGDITAAVRGGLLLEVFLRSHERSATISFLHEAEARSFFDHHKKNDLYVKKKRIDLRWSERQFTLSGLVSNKLGIGATRNLIVRRCDPNITEDTIREDLEHIHNLAIIKVVFSGSSCYVSTNSVHNALFARTCLMSRAKYKGSKIEWDMDECAQPLPPTPAAKPRKEPAPLKRPISSTVNRFQLLNMDDQGEDEDEMVSAFHQANNQVGIKV